MFVIKKPPNTLHILGTLPVIGIFILDFLFDIFSHVLGNPVTEEDLVKRKRLLAFDS